MRNEPPIEERNKRWKKGGGKKPFILQVRYTGSSPWLKHIYRGRTWHLYQRYKTEKARKQALVHLTQRAANARTIFLGYEYRIPPDENSAI